MSSTVSSGVVTLLHTACGAGILAMPYGFKSLGLTLGILAIGFCSLCAMTGLLLQGEVTRYVPFKESSFFTLTQLIHPRLSVIFDLAIAIKCFGVGVSYMIVVGDLLPQIFSTFTSNKVLRQRNFHITMVMLFLVSPLCFIKRLNSLRKASLVALSSVAYLCCLVIVHVICPSDEINQHKGQVSIGFPPNEPTPLTTLPIFVFAFTCHHNAFTVYNEQGNTSITQLSKIGRYSMSIAFIIYSVIGGAGYLTFGDNVTGNIITLYPPFVSTTIGRIAIVLLVMLAFPLQCHPARNSVNNILYAFQSIEKASSEHNESSSLISSELAEEGTHSRNQEPSVPPLHNERFIIITSIILVASYLLAISVTSLAHLLAIVGSTGSTSISFILPGIFGYWIIGSEYIPEEQPRKVKITRYLGLFLIIWGIFVMITFLAASLLLGVSR